MTVKWRTRDGRELLISEMETSHIENCIKMIERNCENHNNAVELDMMFWEIDIRFVLVHPSEIKGYDELVKELSNRNVCG
jgi:hypothetical protein